MFQKAMTVVVGPTSSQQSNSRTSSPSQVVQRASTTSPQSVNQVDSGRRQTTDNASTQTAARPPPLTPVHQADERALFETTPATHAGVAEPRDDLTTQSSEQLRRKRSSSDDDSEFDNVDAALDVDDDRLARVRTSLNSQL